MSQDLFDGLPDELQDLLEDSKKETKVIEIKVEKKKYGKLWATISGVSTDKDELKAIRKTIKNKMACGGTVKDGNIEILYGRNDRSDEVIKILASEGYDKDSIHVTK